MQRLRILSGHVSKNMLHEISAGFTVSDSDLDAGESVVSESCDDALESVMSACGSAFAGSESAHIHGDIVRYDDQIIIGINLVVAAQRLDTVSGSIHIGLRFEQYHPCPLDDPFSIETLEEPAPERYIIAFGQDIDRIESGIMSGVCVFGSGIAESGYHVHVLFSRPVHRSRCQFC